MLAFDYEGSALFVAALMGGVSSIIGAWNARSAAQIKTSIATNGDPREIGQIASDLAAVSAPHSAAETPAGDGTP